ncbi:2TM domain-containing protein [uncultured Flavobacterium sp.]|uniref:2TM domain-containing protein n=1 Tax=uncultured Flavobacterium sp. TaxID=165435 RepID=UPI0025F2E32B|nr:2TM domain-containing protein [uncultured Flavobacterium sp.]
MENSFEDQQRLEKAQKRVEDIKGFYKHLAAYILVNVLLLVMHALNLEPGEKFWSWGSFITPLSWGIGLLAHWVSIYNRHVFFSRDWEERKIREYMEKEKSRSGKWE